MFMAWQQREDETLEVTRVKLPRGREVLGIVQQRLGGGRMTVISTDGKKRNCRIPGRLKRQLWVREGDAVIVEPWELGGDEKGDIVFKYKKNELLFLKKQGYLRQIEEI